MWCCCLPCNRNPSFVHRCLASRRTKTDHDRDWACLLRHPLHHHAHVSLRRDSDPGGEPAPKLLRAC
ncbi:hypothetical protein RB7049 [Rhodopirellula baltica SH 1]|uniref:Uncharacterized protein n=1 Tax=Rhodopirellula baltica (strain DSM 10527 / NCIMB 13988 / SH1) TaxID=243090 RepID=Q7UPB4_RHOBA|nr:hypothetical protein RB7049 [Rhodopirellula baltica SH 1]